MSHSSANVAQQPQVVLRFTGSTAPSNVIGSPAVVAPHVRIDVVWHVLLHMLFHVATMLPPHSVHACPCTTTKPAAQP